MFYLFATRKEFFRKVEKGSVGYYKGIEDMGNYLICRKLLIVAVISGYSFTAAAADGTITFNGNIRDATCIISGGDETAPSQGEDFTVTLPTVDVTVLSSVGKTAGVTAFNINLSGSNCPAGKIANVIFEKASSTNIDTVTGNLKNSVPVASGGAGNVQVQILNKDKTPLNLTANNDSHQTNVIGADNKAVFNYFGQYIAVGGASSAGSVSTDLVYSISYQ